MPEHWAYYSPDKKKKKKHKSYKKGFERRWGNVQKID